MNLYMDSSCSQQYRSQAQKIRVITETWTGENVFCPCCGNPKIVHFPNNQPVADFYCPNCMEEYELKCKAGNIGTTVVDGAYHTMIHRINSENNPHFLFMQYNKAEMSVSDLLFVPKYFVTPDIIEKRKPLPATAKRAGWIGCKINIGNIPESGKIFLIKKKDSASPEDVVRKLRQISFVSYYGHESRGWLLSVLKCVEKMDTVFTLSQLYNYLDILEKEYPNNKHVKEKMRQQLQILRDKGILLFLGNGNYRKLI